MHGALMSAMFEVVGGLYSVCEFSGKQRWIWAEKLCHVCGLIVGYL